MAMKKRMVGAGQTPAFTESIFADSQIQVQQGNVANQLWITTQLAQINPKLVQTNLGLGDKLKEIEKMLKVKWQSPNENIPYNCLMAVRKLLSADFEPPLNLIMDTQLVPILVNFLSYEQNVGIQQEAAWALTNIASGPTVYTHQIVASGALPKLIKLLGCSPSQEVREQCIWAIGNIAGDSTEHRDMALAAGAMQHLLEVLSVNSNRVSMLRTTVWAVSNLHRGKPAPDLHLVSHSLKPLVNCLYVNDDEVVSDTCWGFSYITDCDNERIQAVINTGAHTKIVELLGHPSFHVVTPALRAAGNICTGDDIQTQTIINSDILQKLLTLLTHKKKAIVKESTWTLSNLCAGNVEQIQAVVDSGCFDIILNLLDDTELDIVKEALWTISNALSGSTDAQVSTFVQKSIIPKLTKCLEKYEDSRLLVVNLEAIDHLLRKGKEKMLQSINFGINEIAVMFDESGGLTRLEALQTHPNPSIYDRVVAIMDTYYGFEDAQDQQLAGFIVPVSGFEFS